MIEEAAAGRPEAREEFSLHYVPVVRAYLAARWRGSPLSGEIDDAVQEVFVDFLREGGALARAERDRPGGFRAFLYGVARNVALRFEKAGATRRERAPGDPEALESVPDREESLATAFDRAWALSIVEEAGARCAARAREAGPEAERRYRILRMRFQEDQPVRRIAELLDMEPERAHREYARAREEFREALLDVVAFRHPGDPGEVKREAARLLSFLS